MVECDVALVLGLLAFTHANEIDFGLAEKLKWFSFNFEDNIVYNLMIIEDPGHSTYYASRACNALSARVARR